MSVRLPAKSSPLPLARICLAISALCSRFRQLKPSGILAVHISNRFLDLGPVVAQNAKDLGKVSIDVDHDTDADADDDYLLSSEWILVTADPVIFAQPAFQAHDIHPVNTRPKLRAWTDDYSNLFQIMR